MKTKIWIDNGHGEETKFNKCSPDALKGVANSPYIFFEYKWCREIASRLVSLLRSCGYDADLLVPEQNDISIETRATRVNRTCVERGANNVVLVSIHNNAAASDGNWHSADYWSCWTYRQEIKDINGKVIQVKEASERSKELSRCMYQSAIFEGLKISGFPRKEANFGILRKTLCPAVLVENYFQDNKKNVEWLLSEEGKQAIIRVLFIGLEDYLNPV